MKRRTFLTHLSQGAALAAGGGFIGLARAGDDALSGQHVTIGCSAAMSGILAGAGEDLVAGMNAAFGAINKGGGIHGRELRLQVKDDGYVPSRTADNVKQMIAANTAFALCSCIGTPNNAAIVPLVEAAGIPYVGPITGASSLRAPGQRNVFHVRASYTDEVTRVTQQIVAMGLKNIAVLYLDNAFGKEVAKDAAAALQASQLKAVAMVPVAVDGSNVKQAVAQVAAAQPGAVLLGTTGTTSTALVLQLRAQMAALPIAGRSVSVLPTEIPRLGPALRGIAMTQVFPNAQSLKTEAARSYQAAMRAVGVERFGSMSFEGYVNAMVLAEGLKRAGRDLTREKLRLALTNTKQLALGDYMLGFGNAAPFVASRYVGLAIMAEDGRQMS